MADCVVNCFVRRDRELLLSLPNVQHIFERRPLLFGETPLPFCPECVQRSRLAFPLSRFSSKLGFESWTESLIYLFQFLCHFFGLFLDDRSTPRKLVEYRLTNPCNLPPDLCTLDGESQIRQALR